MLFVAIVGGRSVSGEATNPCDRVGELPLPQEVVAVPPHAGLEWQDCIDLLYAAEGERDPGRALQCCAASRQCDRERAVMYANGWGVEQNLDAALAFLCSADEEMAPAEQASMIAHVESMRRGEEKRPLDFCDHVTSGRGGAFCETLRYERVMPELEARITALGSSLSAPAHFRALVAAGEEFSSAEATRIGEQSRGGTGYAAFSLAAEIDNRERLVETLERYLLARAASASVRDESEADRELNRVYRELIETSTPCAICLEEDKSHLELLRDAQRAWIRYRERFATYYLERWKGEASPAALRREIVVALTNDRRRELEEER
jgi:uncharacterized protein YecT (DUF1311 family)